jgi:hypothetical protein
MDTIPRSTLVRRLKTAEKETEKLQQKNKVFASGLVISHSSLPREWEIIDTQTKFDDQQKKLTK